jgi:hypothetical protein
MIYTDLFKDKVTVIEIDPDNFEKQFSRLFHYPGIKPHDKIESSMHFKLLVGYLFRDNDGLNANTIVEEKDYLSLSYNGDFINYYAHCYKEYGRFCRRIHFFKKKFNKKIFSEMLRHDTKKYKKYWDSYLGHIVIKPLPKGYIGASLLLPYRNKRNRFYTAIRTYSVNLFGKQLFLRTMPFLEQDQIVSSCATSALWFAFHKTGELFRTKIPNPSDITIAAGSDSYNSGHEFPSNALEIPQISRSIQANGLVSEKIVDAYYLQNNKWLKSFIYAYCRMGIPVLLGLDINTQDEHLVTVNGYRFSNRKKKRQTEEYETFLPALEKIEMCSHSIEKFYAHDDQVGPFARLEFIPEKDRRTRLDNQPGSNHRQHQMHDRMQTSADKDFEEERQEQPSINSNHKNEAAFEQLRTSWWTPNANGKDEYLNAFATAVLVPLKKSIKLHFQDVYDQAVLLNFALSKLLSGINFKWDVYINGKGQYKSDLLKELKDPTLLCEDSCRKVLFSSLPEYIWVVRAYVSEDKDFLLFDILYDAADVDIQHNAFRTNFFNRSFHALVQRMGLLNETTGNYEFGLLNYLEKDNSVLTMIDAEVTEMINKKPQSAFRISGIYNEIDKDKLRRQKFAKIFQDQVRSVRSRLTMQLTDNRSRRKK